MKILILGGTVFLGRGVVEAALECGHEVTLFHRGNHGSDLFPSSTHVFGDRTQGFDSLVDRHFDAVLDTSGYLPRVVEKSCKFFTDRTERYVFVSTISVYKEPYTDPMDENASLVELTDPTTEDINGETYGGLKVLCEEVVEGYFPGQSLIIRPGLIVGPNDPTDRFTYWPVRVKQGGEVVAPGNPFQPVQWIDVRDLARWMVTMIEKRQSGVYNATGPSEKLSMAQFLQNCKDALRIDTNFTWLNEAFLLEQGKRPFVDLPIWVPESMQGLHTVVNQKAIDAGLVYRPIQETIRDTVAWFETHRSKLKVGLSRLDEEDLLRKWKVSNQMC